MIGLIWIILTVFGHEGDHDTPEVENHPLPTQVAPEPTALPQEKTPDNGQSYAEVDLPADCRDSSTWETCSGMLKDLILI